MRLANHGSFLLLSFALSLAAGLALTAAGCGPAYCTFRGTINEPANRTMRRALLKKGMGDFCQQLLERNAPLRLSPDSPVIGRFYPVQCNAPLSLTACTATP